MKKILLYCFPQEWQWKELREWLDREYPECELHGVCRTIHSDAFQDRVSELLEYPGEWFTLSGLFFRLGGRLRKDRYALAVVPADHPSGWGSKRLKLATLLLVRAEKYIVFHNSDAVFPLTARSFLGEIQLIDFKILFLPFFIILGVLAFFWSCGPVLLHRLKSLFGKRT